MKARLIILVMLGAGLAVYYARRPAAQENAHIIVENVLENGEEPNLPLWKYDLPGETPDEPPDLALSFSVDAADGKNRIYFSLSEAHDYYVETFVLEFWHKPDADTEYPNSRVKVRHPLDKYIKAGEILEDCVDFTDVELRAIDGDMGTTENWGGRITGRGQTRYRATNPPSLRREEASNCR